MKTIIAAAVLVAVMASPACRGAESSGPPEIALADLELIRAEMKAAGFAPVRPQGNPATGADYWLLWRAWVRRVLFTPMKANTTAVPWGAEAAAFVEKALPARYTPRWVEDANTALVPEARRLMAAGADDAVFLWLAAEVIGYGEETWVDARAVAAKAREAFRKSKYPQVLGAILYRQKADHAIPARPDAETDEALLRAVEYLTASLKDDSTWQHSDAPHLITTVQERFTGALCRKHQDKFRPLFFPQRFPAWARETLAGMWEVEMGWRERGTGRAGEVKEDGRERFGQHLQKAAVHLKKAWELEPKQPFAACRMIAVAMAGGTEETAREWFDRSISAQIDYSPAWTAMSWSLRPRWGGNVRSMVALGLAAVETGRFDTSAPFWCMHALDKAQEEFMRFDDCRDLYRQPAVQAAITGMADGYFRNSRTAAERQHFAWWRALCAWLSGRHALGEPALADAARRPEPDFVRSRLSRFQADQIRLRGEFALAKSGALPAWEKFEAAYTDMDITAAGRILAALPSSPEARPLLQRTGVLMDMEKRLAKGEWLQLTADPALSCWQWVTGRWSSDANGNLVAEGEDERALIIHRVKIGPSFEAKGSFLCLVKDASRFEAGLAITYLTTARGFGNFAVPSVWWNAGEFRTSVDSNWFASRVPGQTLELDPAKPVPWTMRVEEGRLTWTVNGTKVYAGESLTRDGNLGGAFEATKPNSRFGFSLRRSPAHVRVLFSPVAIRRL